MLGKYPPPPDNSCPELTKHNSRSSPTIAYSFNEQTYQVNFATDGVTIGGTLNPRDSTGAVLPEYYVFLQLDGYLEPATNRIVDGNNNWTISNPTNNSIFYELIYPGYSSVATKTVDWIAVGNTPYTNTML